MAAKSWEIRLLREDEEPALYELERAVHGATILRWEQWLSRWRWWNRQNPLAPAVVWVAADGDRLVGQYPLLTFQLLIDGVETLATQNTDLMTHPAYRHQGIFSSLKRHGLRDAASRGLLVSFGFPNASALPGHVKAGSLYLGRLHRAVRIFNWKNATAYFVQSQIPRTLVGHVGRLAAAGYGGISRLARPRARVAIQEVSSFPDEINVLTGAIARRSRVSALRSAAYLNWRYSNPTGDRSRLIAVDADRVAGYAVVGWSGLGGIRIGTLLDCVGDSTAVVETLLRAAVERSASRCDILRFEFTPPHLFMPALIRCGFIPCIGMPGARFYVHSTTEIPERSPLQQLQNWFLALGDSDAE